MDHETATLVNEDGGLPESGVSVERSENSEKEEDMCLILVINMMIVMLMESVLVQIHMCCKS
jgi:hypothetical protein